jgi:uncharacterized protein YciI
MFVSLLSYGGELDKSGSLYAAHRDFIVRHTQEHSVLCAGPLFETDGGAILVYGDDETAARALLDSDPFVQAGYAQYSLHGFKVGLADPDSSLATS